MKKGSRIYRSALAWWLVMHRRGRRSGLAYAAARRASAGALELEQLDARMLKDIGLEGWQSPVGRRIEARRCQDALAWRAKLDGYAGALR